MPENTTPRPVRGSKETREDISVAIAEKLLPQVLAWLEEEVDPQQNQEVDRIKVEVANAIKSSNDPHKIARYLEERYYWSGLDSSFLSIFDQVPIQYLVLYETMLARWVAANAVVAQLAKGTRVRFKSTRDGKPYVGVIKELDARLGRYLVYCSDLHDESGALGTQIPFEDVTAVA